MKTQQYQTRRDRDIEYLLKKGYGDWIKDESAHNVDAYCKLELTKLGLWSGKVRFK